MRAYLVCCGLLAWSVPVAGQSGGLCGVERWPVKTLADAQAAVVLQAPAKTVPLAELIGKPAPTRTELQSAMSTRFPDELSQYEFTAVVIGFKLEADQDFHIVVADPADPRRTMVTEIPAPACVPASEQARFHELRAAFVKSFGKPVPRFRRMRRVVCADVRGAGFFDFLHGQTGVAPNGFELHPVLSFATVGCPGAAVK
jgi:hypothetical protein